MNINFGGLNSIPLFSIFPILIMFLKVGIDNFNMRGVEKKLLTNSKYFIYQVSALFCMSLVLSLCLILVFLLMKGINYWDINSLIPFFSFIVTISLSVVVVLYLVLLGLANLLKFKMYYHIKINEAKWYIVRKLNNKTFLLEDNERNSRLIDITEVFKETIFSEYEKKSERVMKFYNHLNKYFRTYSWILFILVSIGYIVYFIKLGENSYVMGIYIIGISFILWVIIYFVRNSLLSIKNMKEHIK